MKLGRFHIDLSRGDYDQLVLEVWVEKRPDPPSGMPSAPTDPSWVVGVNRTPTTFELILGRGIDQGLGYSDGGGI